MTTPNPYDLWGDVRLPTSVAPVFSTIFGGWGKPITSHSSDPCLAVILDFLATALVTDQMVAAAWRDIAGSGGSDPIQTIWLHNPKEVVFGANSIPALYMWRGDDAKQQWDCDDWYREHTTVKALWAFPIPGAQDNHRRRLPFAHVFAKAMGAAIEVGRTPSWLQPGDPEKLAPTQGSLFYTFAGFDSFELQSWRKGVLVIEAGAGGKAARSAGYESYPALEFTFELVELYETGTAKPPYQPLQGVTATITTDVPTVDLGGNQNLKTWAATTQYALMQFVVPPTANNRWYQCTTAGTSGATAPNFPTTLGATVTDGTVVWTCLGIRTNVADSGPL